MSTTCVATMMRLSRQLRHAVLLLRSDVGSHVFAQSHVPTNAPSTDDVNLFAHMAEGHKVVSRRSCTLTLGTLT